MKILIAGLTLLLTWPIFAEPLVKTLTLPETINIAMKDATAILKARKDSDFGDTAVLQSYMQFLPNLTAQANYNGTKGVNYLTFATPTLVDGKSYGANYTISTALNIFNGFSDIASWKAADRRRDAADKTLERTKQQISLDITQSYLQVILDQELILIAEKNLRASRDREKLLYQQTEHGLRSKSDLFRQQAQASADEGFLINVQNKKQADIIALLKKLRISPDQNYNFSKMDLDAEVEKTKAEFGNIQDEQAIEQALANRRDYKVKVLASEAAKYDVTSARSTFYPKIDLVASYLSSSRAFDYQVVNGANVAPVSSRPIFDQLGDQTSWLYGITLTWSLFDRWVTPTNVERAKVNAYKAELDATDFRNQLVGEVKQSINDYRSALQQLEASERGLKAAQRAYEVSVGKNEVGSLSYVDLAIAQTALVQAEASRAQALTGFYLQKRAFEFALGITPVE